MADSHREMKSLDARLEELLCGSRRPKLAVVHDTVVVSMLVSGH